MDPLLLAMILLGGAFVLVGVRFWSRHGGPFPVHERWTPAKQLIFEAKQEKTRRIATYSMTAGMIILWGSVLMLGFPILSGYLKQLGPEPEARATAEALTSVRIDGCEEKCGDGICSTLSCIHDGCACAESYKTCTKDCPAPPGD